MATTYNSPGVYVTEGQSGSAPIAGVGTSTPVFIGVYGLAGDQGTGGSGGSGGTTTPWAPSVSLCTSFTDFKSKFLNTTETTEPAGRTLLLHSVFGFFQNGGTSCYVTRARTESDMTAVLGALETYDDIEMVLAPGITSAASQKAIWGHCELMQDRVAILDFAVDADISKDTSGANLPSGESSYAAAYHPWLLVPSLTGAGNYVVPPSGLVAGLYARVDASRGVHKAPANEVLFNVVDVQTRYPQSLQDHVNAFGVNLIRQINGNVKVWGARTMGGQDNVLASGDFKYVHVRRLFNFIRSSIKQGTQWTVFEPNNQVLWAKVTRNVSAFLRTLWEQGALFGDTPEQAYYVKCDEEINPPATRNVGQMRAEIGVNITQTAEFVVFTIGQWQPAATS